MAAPFRPPIGRQYKLFTVPADTSRQRTTLVGSRMLLVEAALDAPVMRHIQYPPAASLYSSGEGRTIIPSPNFQP